MFARIGGQLELPQTGEIHRARLAVGRDGDDCLAELQLRLPVRTIETSRRRVACRPPVCPEERRDFDPLRRHRIVWSTQNLDCEIRSRAFACEQEVEQLFLQILKMPLEIPFGYRV